MDLAQDKTYTIEDIYALPENGLCEVFAAPFAVFLNADGKNYVEPDISVICDKNRINEYGCNGAPDWIIEIASPSDSHRDYGIKLFKYRTAGVREYWIVNPMTRTVTVYDFEDVSGTDQYTFDDEISVRIYEDLTLRISSLKGIATSLLPHHDNMICLPRQPIGRLHTRSESF